MKKSLALFATVLAAVLNAATPSTSLVYKNTTTNALTGNIVVGNNTTISATGNGTITATALTGNITGNPTVSGNLTVSGAGTSSFSGSLSVAGQASTINNSTLVMDFNTSGDYGRLLAKNSVGAYTTPIQVVNPLTVQSNLTVSGGTASISHAGSAANIVFKATTNAYAEINANSAIGEFSISSGPSAGWGGFFTWKTDTTERMRLTNTGRLRVGQSIDANDARIYAYYPYSASGGNAAIGTEVDQTTALRAIQFANPNGIVGTIATSGSATSFNTSSDRRLKTNIAPAGSASALIDSIQIVEHDWKAGGHVRFGVIAQDVQTVAPEVVFVGDDGEEVKSPWGVDYSKLVPALIKEVQTLRARVASLEAARN